MSNRKWDTKTKAMVVMAGIRGKPVSEICNEYKIPQSMYYRWRDEFLSNMHQIFNYSDREKELMRENARLKKIIGDLTIELKKSEEDW
jgi:transposase-like protein